MQMHFCYLHTVMKVIRDEVMLQKNSIYRFHTQALRSFSLTQFNQQFPIIY